MTRSTVLRPGTRRRGMVLGGARRRGMVLGGTRQRGMVPLATLLLAAVALLATAALLLGLAAAWYWGDLPPLDKATDYRPHQHLQVFTADGVEIAQFGAERRVFVPMAQMPK